MFRYWGICSAPLLGACVAIQFTISPVDITPFCHMVPLPALRGPKYQRTPKWVSQSFPLLPLPTPGSRSVEASGLPPASPGFFCKWPELTFSLPRNPSSTLGASVMEPQRPIALLRNRRQDPFPGRFRRWFPTPQGTILRQHFNTPKKRKSTRPVLACLPNPSAHLTPHPSPCLLSQIMRRRLSNNSWPAYRRTAPFFAGNDRVVHHNEIEQEWIC